MLIQPKARSWGRGLMLFGRPERAAKLPFQGAVLVCCLLPNALHWVEINITFSHFALNLMTLLCPGEAMYWMLKMIWSELFISAFSEKTPAIILHIRFQKCRLQFLFWDAVL